MLVVSEKHEHKRTLIDWPIGILSQFYTLIPYQAHFNLSLNDGTLFCDDCTTIIIYIFDMVVTKVCVLISLVMCAN